MSQRDLFDQDGGTSNPAGVERRRGKPRLRTVLREQLGLEVVDLDTLIPEDHPARTLWAAVEQLDLTLFYEPIEAREGVAGRSATDPKMLVCLWLYATADGVASARSSTSCACGTPRTSGSAAA